MTAPSLAKQVNGAGVVTADNFNTFIQSCNFVTELRGFAGTLGMQVYMRGFSAIGDGGQGYFYWNVNNAAADDGGVTTIVPNGSTAGAWTRLNSVAVVPSSIQIPTTGFSITIGTGINQLILNPAGTLAAGTVTMPLMVLNNQSVKISTEQTITSLTISPNTNQFIIGAPTTLALGSPAVFTYNLTNLTWYRT